jgi:ABC-type transport system involved in cytochrome bd biosynthesis fused ATPase/permease subunit
MVNIVDNINLHSQNYLDNFFPDNPITVNLSCFKETKKNSKPQINIEISYKGMDCDINSLSGGETSRVILAFTLALAEMFNTPLLMLDECTASLDSESTSIVFDTIKENFRNKSVLVVAHQCTEGIFDKIIKL